MKCIIIVSQGGKYDAKINAIALVGSADGLMKKKFIYGVQERSDIKIVQKYLRDDYLKEVADTLYDLPDHQYSRQYYLDYIENIFQHSTKGGGMYTYVPTYIVSIYVFVP